MGPGGAFICAEGLVCDCPPRGKLSGRMGCEECLKPGKINLNTIVFKTCQTLEIGGAI